MRNQKIFRSNYVNKDSPTISLLEDPNEVRMASNASSFFGVQEEGVTVGAGVPAQVNIQGLSNALKYGGVLQDLPFPLSLIPSTAATPTPKQIPILPFKDLLPAVKELAALLPMLLR